jgi:hypothetical protein
MSEKMRATGKAVAWATAGALGATVLTGIAFAGTSGAQPATSAAVQTHDGRGPGGEGGPGGRGHGPGDGRFLGRVMHGEVVVENKDGDAVTVAIQNGEVTAVDADSVTVKSADGFTKTWKLTADTKVREGREDAAIADISVGDTVHVGSGDTGSTDTAARVGIRPADAPDEPAEGAQSGAAVDPAGWTTA